jgi:hypothetical protein
VVDGDSVKPFLSCLKRTAARTIWKRRDSSFYSPKDTFNGILLSMAKYLKSRPVFSKNWTEIVYLVNKKFHGSELIAPV